MYNRDLAIAILKVLVRHFPQTLQMIQVKSSLQQYSHLPSEEWFLAIDAL
jgi:hypothetical protein